MRKLKIAMLSPNPAEKTETFIRAQLGWAGADWTLICDGYLPGFVEGEGALTGRGLFSKIKNRLETALFPSRMNEAERDLCSFLKKGGFDCALVQYGPTAARSARALRTAGLPWAVHFHGMDAHHFGTIEKYGRYQEVFSEAKKVFAVSGPMVENLLKLGCPAEKLVLNPYGPHPEYFGNRPCFCSTTFLFVGRFTPKKAPLLLLEAFFLVKKQVPKAKLVMAGQGPLFKEATQKAAELGLADSVAFPGNVGREQILRWMSDGLAYVQHSITAPGGDMEGTPVAILEASAAGLPVVATHHAGIPATVIEGETGFLVEENDVAAMAERMVFLAKNSEKAEEMGAKGRRHIAENFSVERHLSVLGETLNGLY